VKVAAGASVLLLEAKARLGVILSARDLASPLPCTSRRTHRAFSALNLSHSSKMAPGERSEEVHLWYTAVFEACQEIPRGNYFVSCISRINELTAEQARSRATGTSRDSSGSVSYLLHHQGLLLTHVAANQLNVPGTARNDHTSTLLTHDVKDKLECVSNTCHRRRPIAARRVRRSTVLTCRGSACSTQRAA